MAEEVKNYTVDRKYRVSFKRSDVKGVDGFTVESNSDNADEAMSDALKLYKAAIFATTPPIFSTTPPIQKITSSAPRD